MLEIIKKNKAIFNLKLVFIWIALSVLQIVFAIDFKIKDITLFQVFYCILNSSVYLGILVVFVLTFVKIKKQCLNNYLAFFLSVIALILSGFIIYGYEYLSEVLFSDNVIIVKFGYVFVILIILFIILYSRERFKTD